MPEPLFLFGRGYTFVLAALLTGAGGAASMSMRVPDDANLVGASLFLQSAALAATQLVVRPACGVTIR